MPTMIGQWRNVIQCYSANYRIECGNRQGWPRWHEAGYIVAFALAVVPSNPRSVLNRLSLIPIR